MKAQEHSSQDGAYTLPALHEQAGRASWKMQPGALTPNLPELIVGEFTLQL